MELRIDFYSKEEVSIQMDFSKRYPFPSNGANELFLFTCFTLRQFSNFEKHPVGMVLAVLLATDTKYTTIEFSKGNYEFPNPNTLRYQMGNKGVLLDIDYYNFEDQIMPGLPKLVDFRGEGKKAFIVTIPPFIVKLKGFGWLGFQINYFAFQATITLFKYLAEKHVNDELYLDHLSKVANYCGELHIKGAPLHDQVEIATAIFKEAGVIS
jgi:hypothetical protein